MPAGIASFWRPIPYQTLSIRERPRGHSNLGCRSKTWTACFCTGDWLTDWLTDRLVDWLTDWLTNWLNDWLTDWQSDWLIEWLTDWLVDWLTDWPTDWLTHWHSKRPSLGTSKCVVCVIEGKPLQYGMVIRRQVIIRDFLCKTENPPTIAKFVPLP